MIRPQTQFTASGFLAHVRSGATAMVPAERRVAEVLLMRLEQIPEFSVVEVAGAAGCSTATVVWACQRLGFTGYQQLRSEVTRHALAEPAVGAADVPDVGREATAVPGAVAESAPLAPRTGQDALLERVFAAAREDLETTEALLDRTEFSRAVGLLAGASTILMLGTGGSAIPAQDAALRFTMAGRPAHAPSDVLAQQFSARMLRREDVCVAISFSGANRHTLAAVDAARLAGARVIAVTSTGLSPLGKVADLCLVTGTASAESEILSSRVAHMLVLNALNLAVQQSNGQPSFGPSATLTSLLSQALDGGNPPID